MYIKQNIIKREYTPKYVRFGMVEKKHNLRMKEIPRLIFSLKVNESSSTS